MRKLWLALVLVWLGAVTGHAAEEAIKVFFNGQPTRIETTEVTGGKVVPVYFPVQEGETVYEVHLQFDAAQKKLIIQRKPIKPHVRGDDPCYYCSGSGICQNCFPLGSGVTASGAVCGLCNGSTKCCWCGGTGKK